MKRQSLHASRVLLQCMRSYCIPADTGQPKTNQQFPNTELRTVCGDSQTSFSKIDETNEVDGKLLEEKALIALDEETYWKNKLMFVYEFRKTPKHLTWAEFGKEVECLECSIDADSNRPEEIYHIEFYFRNRSTDVRQKIFKASNNVANGEGLCDLLAALGTCLTRPEVHRTVRFDAGKGRFRDINIRKTARYTSEIMIAFRPPNNTCRTAKEKVMKMPTSPHPLSMKEQMKYAMAKTCSFFHEENLKGKQSKSKVTKISPRKAKTPSEIANEGKSEWGFHPSLMDADYQDQDPPGTYHLAMSAHAFGCVVTRAIERLIQKPLKSFYRPSQLSHSYMVENEESVGIAHAVYGWLGFEDKVYPHYTPLDAVQGNWLGDDAPFRLTALMCKIRELSNLTKKNPETLSWLSVRYKDTSLALRNINAKLSGAGPSRLFWPASYNPTINKMLPKKQQKKLRTRVSIAGFLGFNDRTQNLPRRDSAPQLDGETSDRKEFPLK